jgi:hypothetical protein
MTPRLFFNGGIGVILNMINGFASNPLIKANDYERISGSGFLSGR